MKRFTKLASLLIISSFLFSCNTTVVVQKDILDPIDIVLNEKEKTLNVGDQYQIHAKYIVDDKEENVNFAYKSLNMDVATVSNTGLVDAVGAGEAIIQITYESSKTLLKIIVQGNQSSSTLGINIFDNLISLYKDDQYEFRYEARLDGSVIDLAATYYDYDSSIISIVDNVITALDVGTTNAKIKVTYGELVAEESFTVSVKETKYNLSCNYEKSQVVVGEEDLEVTYSLNYGSQNIKNITLSEMECHISSEEIAQLNGDTIKGIKKGLFDLEVSYHNTETGETITSVDSFRCREKYVIKSLDLVEPIYVLDGDRIPENVKPISDDPSLVFDSWLKDGIEFNEPVESNLRLGVKWKINEFNFAQDIRDAKSVAPSVGEEGETIDATPYDDGDIFINGLSYLLSDNRLPGDEETYLDTVANIYLPKIDYRKTSTISYNWKTNGYVLIGYAGGRMDGGSLPLGGTIDITYDGETLKQTITQLYDAKQTIGDKEIDYKNVQIILECDDLDVIQGNENLKSISYWSNESAGDYSKYIYLSNPKVSTSHDYLPYIWLDNYVGEAFYTEDPNAHYEYEYKRPTITRFLSEDRNVDEDYLFYDQDRQYDEGQGWTHCRADYTLTLPAINFAIQGEKIIIPCEVIDGFYIGFSEEKAVTNCSGYIVCDYKQETGLNMLLLCDTQEGTVQYGYVCEDEDVINGNSGFTFPVCYSMFCFERGVKFYQPQICKNHNFVNVDNIKNIGYSYENVCSICGEKGEQPKDVMHLSDIDFTVHQYGAHGGVWGTNVQPTTTTVKYEAAKAEEAVVSLPRIDFKAFDSVEFSVKCDSFAIGAGLESGSYILPYSSSSSSPAHTGVLTFELGGDGLHASLKCNEISQVQNIVITDSRIINGDESVNLYIYCPDYQWQTVTFELTSLASPCTHNFVNTASSEKIGYYDTVCSICGEIGDSSEDIMGFDDVDFTIYQYGAQGGKWGTYVQPTAKTMVFEVTAASTENEIKLPKINFSLYKSVSFTLAGNDWSCRVGLATGSYAFPYAYRAEPYSGTLTFTIDENQVIVSLNCVEGTTQNVVISDPDIINGNKSFSLYMIADQIYRTITAELTNLSY